MSDQQGRAVIDVDGNAYIICGVQITKCGNSYGYTLDLELINGKVKGIAYAYDDKQLMASRDAIASHIASSNSDALDMRETFIRVPGKASYYDCTIAKR